MRLSLAFLQFRFCRLKSRRLNLAALVQVPLDEPPISSDREGGIPPSFVAARDVRRVRFALEADTQSSVRARVWSGPSAEKHLWRGSCLHPAGDGTVAGQSPLRRVGITAKLTQLTRTYPFRPTVATKAEAQVQSERVDLESIYRRRLAPSGAARLGRCDGAPAAA